MANLGELPSTDRETLHTVVGIETDRVAELLSKGWHILVLDALLYHACLRVSLENPRNPAVKDSRLYPNTRGVTEVFRKLYEKVRPIVEQFGLTKSLVDRYVQLRFREWWPHDLDYEGKECRFFIGCPINVLETDDVEFVIDSGICPIHRDHIIPASHGGRDTQPMCAYHNRLKQDNWFFQPDLLQGWR